MKIYTSYRERIAGIFLLLAALSVVLFLVGTAVENRWFEARVTFHTHVVRGDGLRKGSPVLLSGIDVGEIGELTILDDNRIDVEIVVLEKHAHRLREGSKAEVRRLLGIGEKRINLISAGKGGGGGGAALPAGALLPADEPIDLLDAVSAVDLGQYIKTMDRAVAAMEILLGKLEEENRLERMVEAFDQMGPTMSRLNELLSEINEPLAALLNDPSMRGTMRGADKVFNDPATRASLRRLSGALEPERVDRLMVRTDSLLARFDALLAEDSHLTGTLAGADRLMNDGRMDRMLTALEKLTDAEKLEKLVDNLGVLAEQMAKIGPEIPSMTREMTTTMREAVIVLKALQKTWLLKDESKDARKEIEKIAPAVPAGQ
ncbi:MAG TPA: MlaD family protein [Polyangia bacterium]|nr:MlaD family protein [Polyangia bacterium]